jgi:hypothetical protein
MQFDRPRTGRRPAAGGVLAREPAVRHKAILE